MSDVHSAENDAAPRLASACKCGDCFHPLVGANTDGEPCEWCIDCGCNADDHTRMTRVNPPGATEAAS